MATLPFDTHKAVKDLQEAGFDETQAEALVATVGTAIVGNVATKYDIMEARNESKSETQALRAEIQAQGSELRAEMQTQGSELRAEMQAMELRITLRMGGLIIAGVGLIVALDKLL